MPQAQIFCGLLIGSGLFVFVVVLVFLLVWFRPTNLTYDRATHFRTQQLGFGDRENTVFIAASKKMGPPPNTDIS